MYFRIGEAAGILGVKPYVLRYWETEFPEIKPVKSKSNQRLYKKRDVELLMVIKELLYEEKFTIDGARQHLKELMRAQSKEPETKSGKSAKAPESMKKAIANLKTDLKWCIEELRKS